MDRLRDYDYELPDGAIAQTPLTDRAASKLLWLNRATGEIQHLRFRDAGALLNPGDLLVLNNTRVTAIRIFGHKPSGGAVELLLLRDLGDSTFEAMARPGKRLRLGAIIEADGVSAEVVGSADDGRKLVRITGPGPVNEALQRIGTVPLPPYIKTALAEPSRYQTVYAGPGGSSASPTAGLHFTAEMLNELRVSGVEIAYVTLDVGIDTFRPVQSEFLSDHEMHGERFSIPEKTAEMIRGCVGRVIAVGTTTVRALESAATWNRDVTAGDSISRLFIRPGFGFQIVDGMFTNFHMPRTTMLCMISAFAGRASIFKAYAEALETDYRFLSFGDSMIIL